MDVLFISLQKTPLFRFGVSPNKLMDYMMAGKPVIQAIEAGNDLVRESGCGISVKPEDPEAVVAAVLQLMSCKPAEREAMGHRGKQYVLAHHDYRILVQQFLGILPQAQRARPPSQAVNGQEGCSKTGSQPAEIHQTPWVYRAARRCGSLGLVELTLPQNRDE